MSLECSGHGVKVGDECHCDPGWTGVDELLEWKDCHISTALVLALRVAVLPLAAALLLRVIHSVSRRGRCNPGVRASLLLAHGIQGLFLAIAMGSRIWLSYKAAHINPPTPLPPSPSPSPTPPPTMLTPTQPHWDLPILPSTASAISNCGFVVGLFLPILLWLRVFATPIIADIMSRNQYQTILGQNSFEINTLSISTKQNNDENKQNLLENGHGVSSSAIVKSKKANDNNSNDDDDDQNNRSRGGGKNPYDDLDDEKRDTNKFPHSSSSTMSFSTMVTVNAVELHRKAMRNCSWFVMCTGLVLTLAALVVQLYAPILALTEKGNGGGGGGGKKQSEHVVQSFKICMTTFGVLVWTAVTFVLLLHLWLRRNFAKLLRSLLSAKLFDDPDPTTATTATTTTTVTTATAVRLHQSSSALYSNGTTSSGRSDKSERKRSSVKRGERQKMNKKQAQQDQAGQFQMTFPGQIDNEDSLGSQSNSKLERKSSKSQPQIHSQPQLQSQPAQSNPKIEHLLQTESIIGSDSSVFTNTHQKIQSEVQSVDGMNSGTNQGTHEGTNNQSDGDKINPGARLAVYMPSDPTKCSDPLLSPDGSLTSFSSSAAYQPNNITNKDITSGPSLPSSPSSLLSPPHAQYATTFISPSPSRSSSQRGPIQNQNQIASLSSFPSTSGPSPREIPRSVTPRTLAAVRGRPVYSRLSGAIDSTLDLNTASNGSSRTEDTPLSAKIKLKQQLERVHNKLWWSSLALLCFSLSPCVAIPLLVFSSDVRYRFYCVAELLAMITTLYSIHDNIVHVNTHRGPDHNAGGESDYTVSADKPEGSLPNFA